MTKKPMVVYEVERRTNRGWEDEGVVCQTLPKAEAYCRYKNGLRTDIGLPPVLLRIVKVTREVLS